MVQIITVRVCRTCGCMQTSGNRGVVCENGCGKTLVQFTDRQEVADPEPREAPLLAYLDQMAESAG